MKKYTYDINELLNVDVEGNLGIDRNNINAVIKANTNLC